MELKTARLTLLIDPHKKEAFERLCAPQDRTASQMVRQLTRDYLAQHGVQYMARGVSAREFAARFDLPALWPKSGSPDAAPSAVRRRAVRPKA
ncbi:CopG family transcriptional regulator [Variovorax sp. LjRoot290]|uniref:ribbon-helix-helix protein, CopG family n=1 Tax=unclassified Variovorax TaxID=663243 RepID=UPI003ECC620F